MSKYKKITLTLPEETIKKLVTYVPSGQRSSFVNDALSQRFVAEYIKRKIEKPKDPVEELIDLGKDLPKIDSEDILRLIKKGRKQ